ncbi:hypothetical protein [Neorhizobium sp. JUb45]|uniref:hypothetical protein n=1 Tax=Neorhizobium sp. JUb45 TaxID=2485113 RepID=UPI00104997CB|nr:hypothetical protein [Neorhizobium sp. JUb45]
MIFTLAPNDEKITLISEKPRIEVGARRHGALSALEAIETILQVMRTLGIEEKFQSHGKILPLTKMLTSARKTDRLSRFETEGLTFQYGPIADHNQCYIQIAEKLPSAAVDWEQWAKPFVMSPHFVQAWLADVEYDKWQNAKDPLIYKAANRDYSSLPMRSNGLPPPVEQMVIDISQNPGRWWLRSGYVEAVGSVMWLSDIFWHYVGAQHKERLETIDPIEIKQITEKVIRLSVSDSTFTETSFREVQDRLRDALYTP